MRALRHFFTLWHVGVGLVDVDVQVERFLDAVLAFRRLFEQVDSRSFLLITSTHRETNILERGPFLVQTRVGHTIAYSKVSL